MFHFAVFKGVRSTHILGVLLSGLLAGLGITTIPEHDSVGSVTLEMTPMSSILWNSVLTASLRGRGTHRGAHRTTDTALCSNSM